MQRNYSLEAFHGQCYGTTGVTTAIYIDSLPRYILMILLRGGFLLPGTTDNRPSEVLAYVEEGMGKQKLDGQEVSDGGRATASKQRAKQCSE